MLAVVISCIVVVPLALLLFFALARMKRLRRLKIHAGVGKFITLSFEVDADDHRGELSPQEKTPGAGKHRGP